MARKRLNRKVVIALTLVAFAAIVLLSAVMLNRLRQRDPKFFVDLARQARAEDQWEVAANLYKKAWERSHRAEHLVELGEVLLEAGDVQNAMAAWNQAQISDPNLPEAHKRRLELLLERAKLGGGLDAWRQAREAAEGMLAIEGDLPDAERAFAHHARGLALVNGSGPDQEQHAKGREELTVAAELAPEVVDYPLELAALHFREGEAGRGEALMNRLLADHAEPSADAAKVRWSYGQHLAAQGKYDEAERLFQGAVRFAGDDVAAQVDARLAYAVFLTQQWAQARRSNEDSAVERFEAAERMLRTCIEAKPDSYRPYLRLALLYKSAGRHEDVLATCKQRLERGLQRTGVHAARDRLHTFSLLIHASDACLAQVVEAEREGEGSLADAERKQWLDQAQKYADQAAGEAPNHPRVLAQLGRVKVARGELRAAVEDLRAAHEVYESFGTMNWDNVVVLARVHMRLNEPGAAREVFEDVLEEARRQRIFDPDFWLLYGQTLLGTNATDQALAIADRVLLADPDNADAMRLKAAVYERQGKRAEAGRLLEESTGDQVMRTILTAREASLEGRPEAALRVLRAGLEAHPADPRLVRSLVSELVALDRRSEAAEVVAEALQSSPDNPLLKRLSVMLREDLSDEQRDQATLALIEAEPDAYKRSLDLISYRLSNDDSAGALEAIDAALTHVVEKDTPLSREATLAQHRALLRAKVRMAARINDSTALAEARDAAVKYNIDGVGGKTVIGLYHMAREEYELAATALRQALDEQPTDAWALTHLAQALQALGRLDEAETAFKRALEVNPDDALAHRGLAWLAKTRGRADLFEEHLEECARLLPDDPWVQRELLAQQERLDPKAAIHRREQLLREKPEDRENLQRLAALCELAGELEKADRYFTRLLELSPDSTGVAARVAGYFRRTDRPERAIRVLRDFAAARESDVERADALILIAAHFLELGDTADAEASLLEASGAAETLNVTRSLAEFYWNHSDKPHKALEWLSKAIDLARASAPETLPPLLEARVAYRLDPRTDDPERARRDVDELLAEYPDNTQAYLFSSELHARAGRVEEAVAALTEHLARRPSDPNALYRRARHNVTLGRIGLAINDLETLKRVAPSAMGFAPRLLLADLYRRTDRQERWLRELESVAAEAPESVEAVEQLVRAYLRADRPTEADRLVTAQINRAKGAADPRWYFLRGVVSFELGDVQRAIDEFRRGAALADYSVPASLRLLDALARAGRLQEAVSFCRERSVFENDDVMLLSRCSAMLARSGRMDEAVRTFQRAMAAALEGAPQLAAAVTADLRSAFPDSAAAGDAIARFQALDAAGTGQRARDRILVRLYQIAGRLDDASSLLAKLVQSARHDRERAVLYQIQGDVHQYAGRAEGARQAYEEALKYDPDNWVVLNNLAYLLTNDLGAHADAVRFARRAVALSDNPSALDTLGWAYVGQGRFDSAIAELSRAVRQAPEDALAQYHLGEAYRRSGRSDRAMDVLQSARDLARSDGSSELLASIEAALERLQAGDRSP